MPITIKVLDPVDGELVKFEVTWTSDHEFGSVYLDEIENGAPRHAIVFFKAGKGDGVEKSTDIISTGITHDPSHTVPQTFTALAVQDAQVVAKDRKRVRNARSAVQ